MPNGIYWFISPTYSQAKTQYRRLLNMLTSCKEVMAVKNETELRIKLINGSEIVFKSGESHDNLRGATLHGVVIDEMRDMHPELWPMVVRPMIATTKGWACFSSTPRGYDAFFDLSEKEKTDPEWATFKAPSTCNPLFTQTEFENARAEMSEGFFAQEILAEFRDLHAGSAYINFGDHNLAPQSPFTRDQSLVSPHLPIVVALDFNLAPAIALLGQERVGEFYWFDEVYVERSHTQEIALEIVTRLRKIGNKQPVVLIGDATGKAGQRAAMGRSDYSIIEEILSQSGIQYINRTPDANPQVRDRVNVVNSKLKAADGTTHIWLNPNTCPRLRRDLQRVSWKRGLTDKLDQVTDSTLTHLSDAMGYAVCGLSKLWQPEVGRMKVIVRR